MNIDEIRNYKKELDESISELIFNFQNKTGLLVESIELYRFPTYTGFNEVTTQGITVQTKVRI